MNLNDKKYKNQQKKMKRSQNIKSNKIKKNLRKNKTKSFFVIKIKKRKTRKGAIEIKRSIRKSNRSIC